MKRFTSSAALAGLLIFLTSAAWAIAITAVDNNDTPQGYCRYIKPGETGIDLTGTSFGSSQGAGQVYLATGPYHTASLTETAQTVTSWGNTAITFTASNATGFSHGQMVFILVKDNSGSYTAPGIPAYIWKTTPTVTAVTGSLTHGSTVTALGSDFLTRSDEHTDSDKLVYMFDDYNRSSLTANPYRSWAEDGSDLGTALSISNSSPRTSRTGDKYLHRVGATGTDYLQTYMGDKTEYHFAGWIRLNVSYSGGTQQIKFERQYGTGDTGEDVYILHSGGNGWGYAEDGGSDPLVACTDYEDTPNITGNTWIFYEHYFRHASCASCLDGEQWVKFNNKIGFDYWKNFNVNNPQPCFSNSFMGGEYQNNNGHAGMLQSFPSYDDGWTAPSYADIDDMVYDASRATVLLSTASTYSSSTGFEIQTPIIWTSTSISFQLRAGAIADANIGSSYLYIVDKWGIVNENGFRLNSSTNSAPSVDAGVDQNSTYPDAVSLDGTVSDDVAVMGTTWTVVSGPGGTFGNANAVDTTFTPSASGTHVLRLTASDGSLTASDDITITVSDPAAPSSPQHLRIQGPFRISGPVQLK